MARSTFVRAPGRTRVLQSAILFTGSLIRYWKYNKRKSISVRILLFFEILPKKLFSRVDKFIHKSCLR